MSRPALLCTLLILSLLLTATVGFAHPQSSTSAKKPVPAKTKKQKTTSPVADKPRPKQTPPGVVICDPVVVGANRENIAHFANGIGWYLTDAVAGAPELGQSPLRTTVLQVAQERGIKPLLRVSLRDAGRISRATGATHFATGEITENSSGVTLTYRLYRLPMRENAPSLPSGTITTRAAHRAELVTLLPGIGQKLREALGVRASAVTPPPLVGVTPEILAQFGNSLENGFGTPTAQQFLAEHAKRLPLVAELALAQAGETDMQTTLAYAGLLLTTMPYNAQALDAVVSRVHPSALADRAATIYALSDRYPTNYAFAQAACRLARWLGNTDQADRTAMRAAQDAPANAEARVLYGQLLSEQTERIRRSRTAQKLQEDGVTDVWEKIPQMYHQWVEEAEAAVRIDPLSGNAWMELSAAATFHSKFQRADNAMTHARSLTGVDRYRLYWWALEMYAPKWTDNVKRLSEIADEAVKAPYANMNQEWQILKKLTDLELVGQRHAMEVRIEKECEALIARNPNDNLALYLRGRVRESMGKSEKADIDFEQIAKNMPTVPGAWTDLGRHYLTNAQQAYKKAEQVEREILKTQPNDAWGHAYLGDALAGQGQLQEARTEWQRAVTIGAPAEAVTHAQEQLKRFPSPGP